MRRFARNRAWREIELPGPAGDLPDGAAYQSGDLRALVSREFGRWHLSLSVSSPRYPTWDELADARYDLLPPHIDVALFLPPPWDYTNHHPHVLQMSEVRDPGLPIDRGLAMPRTRQTLGGMVGAEHLV